MTFCTKRTCDVAVGAVEVEGFGIEATAAPSQCLAVLGMAGIGDDLEEVGIAGSTPDVLGWTGSGASDAGSGAGCGIDGDQAFEGDVVLPVVTKIVR